MTDTRLVRRMAGVALLLVGIAPAFPRADELSWRVVSHVVKWDIKPVGDVEGHVSGPWARHGLAFFKGGPVDGEVAVYVNAGTIDQTKESRRAEGEAVMTFEDGATIRLKSVTSGPPTSTLRVTATVTSDVIGGTGRFAGITGKATGTGRIMTPAAGETKGDAYYDMVLTYTLPKPRS